jgi:predicted dinucleotide-binding enzyme
MSEPASSEEQRNVSTFWSRRARGSWKAFNTVLASRQADPQVNDMSVDNFVAGSDEDGTATVIELIWSIGMRRIDAGHLSSARILEARGA